MTRPAILILILLVSACTALDPSGSAERALDAAPEPVSAADGGSPSFQDGSSFGGIEGGAHSDAATSMQHNDGEAVGGAVEAGAADAAGAAPTSSADASSDASPTSMADASSDASLSSGNDAAPSGECDELRACSLGYRCSGGKCVSACAQKACDSNASCALRAGTAVCSCNSGFVAQGSVDDPVCKADLACEQLKCDEHASCDVMNGLRVCTCKLGYTGNGTSCLPVACPTLTLAHGSVTGGTHYGDTVTYDCHDGYQPSILAAAYTRTCGAEMTWSGSAIDCLPVSCGVPPLVPGGVAAPNTVGRYNDTATYTCSTGTTLAGNNKVTCLQTGAWSTPPRCVPDPVCGNGVKETGELCDPKEAGTDPWKCDPLTCRPRTTYNPCWSPDSSPSDADCSNGEICRQGVCTKSCSDAASCPKASLGTAVCSQGLCVVAACERGCSTGLLCSTNPFPVSCRGCLSSQDCWSTNRNCVNSSGSIISSGGYGRCK